MTEAKRFALRGLKVTSLGTLVSRILGMLRDSATAALLGLSGSPVMDAFVVAFRVPNLFRSLFGEGALTASYLPVATAEFERGRHACWRLASAALVCLAAGLTLLVLLGEAVCAAMWYWNAGDPLVIGLAAALLPYVIFVCLAAQAAATLQALRSFTAPALAPSVLNAVWLISACLIAPRVAAPGARAYVLAACIAVGGIAQWLIQLAALRRRGFRFDWDWQAARPALGQVAAGMGAMTLGLATTQISVLLGSWLAWGMSAGPHDPQTISWLGGVEYPLRQGAASALFYAQRLYQFPVGLVGVAVATVIFPLLSRHAARGRLDEAGRDLTNGLRLVMLLGIPASAGLAILAHPIARLLFERGEFTPADTARTAAVIQAYSAGVWAYCALPVIVRGYYALGDRMTPVRIGLVTVTLGLLLSVALMWPLAESGLALANSLAAGLQVFALAWGLNSKSPLRLNWRPLWQTIATSSLATGCMALVILGSQFLPAARSAFLGLAAPLGLGAILYFVLLRCLRGDDLSLLATALGRRKAAADGTN